MKVEIDNKEYNVPMSWDEVTLVQGIEVFENVNDKAKQLECLTGIPVELVDKMLDVDAQKLFALISFTENLEVFNDDNVLDEFKDFDFGSIPYGESEKCRKMIAQSSSDYLVTIKIINYLKNVNMSNEPFLKTIGTVNFFFYQLMSSLIVTPYLTKLNKILLQCKRDQIDLTSMVASPLTLN